MPFTKERAGKTAHAEFIENPDISSLVEQSKYLKEPSIETAKQLADGFKPVPGNECEIPPYVYASDGSFYEASLDERYPSTKVGYVKVSSLILDVKKYIGLIDPSSRISRYIDPLALNQLEKDVRALSMALPSSNLRYNESSNVSNGFRQRLFEEFTQEKTRLPNAGTLLDTFYRLSSSVGRHGTRKQDGEYVVFVHKCPNCGNEPADNGYGEKGYAIEQSNNVITCHECSASIYPTDSLRLHETITDHGGLSNGLSRIMNVSEYVLLAHTIIDCLRGDYQSTLSDICFFIDGPLAFFGQPAWLHRPIMKLIYDANQRLKNLGKPPFLMIGIQKQGTLADHARMISRHLPRNSYRFVDDEYRSRHISPVPAENNFGNETYFGQDIIFHTPKGNIFVLGVPYPFLDKSRADFKTAKVDVKNYENLDKIFAMTKIFEADLYGGSLIPIVIAHRNASISRMPGGKVLDIASRIGFSGQS